MLELERVSKQYGATVALHEASLRVDRGQTAVLIGESGSGKSTVLRAITGLLVPDSGEVRWDGTRIEPSTVQALRLRVGYVIQEGGLFPHLTAYDNTVLMARHLGWDKAKIDARVHTLRELMRLPDGALERHPRALSGGQRQRVGLMRALMLDPELLLLDEPLGALDPITRSELQNDLRTIFAELKKTVVIVTHDIGEAAIFGDFIVVMRDGRVVQRGTLDDLIQRPSEEFVTRFIHAQQSPISLRPPPSAPAEDA